MRQVDGAKLRRIRQERGIRPEALALQIHRSVQTINCYEIGRAQPPVPVLCQLADALGVGVEDLLTPSLGKAPQGTAWVNQQATGVADQEGTAHVPCG